MSDIQKLKVDTNESVALELTKIIAKAEGFSSTDPDYRIKYLKLYQDCRKATYGNYK